MTHRILLNNINWGNKPSAPGIYDSGAAVLKRLLLELRTIFLLSRPRLMKHKIERDNKIRFIPLSRNLLPLIVFYTTLYDINSSNAVNHFFLALTSEVHCANKVHSFAFIFSF
jgi:hypothetical protein